MGDFMDKLGGRKVIVGIVVLAIGVTMVLVKGDITANLLQLLEVVFGAFVVGNVGEHIVNGSVMKAETKAPIAASEDVKPIIEVLASSLARLEESSAKQEQAAAVTQQAISAIMVKAGIRS